MRSYSSDTFYIITFMFLINCYFSFLDYKNPIINSTYPSINSIIPLSTTNISITYNTQISPSIINNITIYQDINGTSPLLRQTLSYINPKQISYSVDNKTLFLNVLKSIFN